MKAKHAPTSPHAQLRRALNASIRDRQCGVLRDPYQRPQPAKGQPRTLGEAFARKLRIKG